MVQKQSFPKYKLDEGAACDSCLKLQNSKIFYREMIRDTNYE